MNTLSCEEDRICKMFASGYSIDQISKIICSERNRAQKIRPKEARGIVESALHKKAFMDNKPRGAECSV